MAEEATLTHLPAPVRASAGSDDRLALLELGERATRRFGELILDGTGAAALVDATAQIAGRPVTLATAGGAILYRSRSVDSGLATDDGRVHPEWGSPRGITVPVRHGRDPEGAALAASPGSGPGAAVREVLERAAPFAGIALMRDSSLSGVRLRSRGNFLRCLVEHRGEIDERDVASVAAGLGFERATPQLLSAAIGSKPGIAPTDETWGILADGVVAKLRAAGYPALIGIDGDGQGLLVAIGLEPRSERVEVACRVAESVEAVSGEADPAPSLSVSVGPIAQGWRRFRDALRATIESARAASFRPPAPWHDVAIPDVADLLWAWRSDPALHRISVRLEPLIESDRNSGSHLVKTLDTLYRHGFHKAAAARSLHIERQSVYKRIAKIEEVIGASLDDEDTRLTMHLAIRRCRALSYRVGTEAGVSEGNPSRIRWTAGWFPVAPPGAVS